MRKLLWSVVLLAACSVSTEDVADDLKKIVANEPRALTCPGTSADDVCILFNDTTAAAVSFTPTTTGTVTGEFKTGSYAIPMTGVSDGAKYTFYFCPGTLSTHFSESTISMPVEVAANATASFVFSYKDSGVGVSNVAAQAFARDTFPATTTAPALPSANGDWLLVVDPQEPTPLYIAEHDTLLLFLSKGNACSGWYGVENQPQQFKIPTGAEKLPLGYTQGYGSFSQDYLTALLVVLTSSGAEEQYTLRRP